jgi:hypothetical protein
METKTIVRIENQTAEWTPDGWKSDDPATAAFCEYVICGSSVSLPFFSNRHRPFAEQLLTVCRTENIDAELISLGGCDLPFTDPDDPDAVF